MLDIIEEELDKYKLYINKAKCFEMKRPFMTSISVSKIESIDYLRALNRELFCYTKGDNDELVFEEEIRYQTRFSGSRISALKAIIKHNDVSYEHISRICLSRLCKMFSAFCRKSFASISYIENSSEISKRIWILLDISFFIYSMDINPRTTHIISRLIFNISNFCENLNKSDSEDVQKKIFDESLRCIELCSRQSPSRVEISNLFIALTFLKTPFIIPESLFIDVFDINNFNVATNRLDYFSLITILFCIKDRADVPDLRRHVISRIKEILNCPNFMTNTESVLIFFDTVSCPHIGKQDKIDFTSIVFDKMGKGSLGEAEVRRVVNLIGSQTWFIDWSAHKNFENLLHKKELRTPY